MSTIRLKLFLMMIIQFFIWGAWLPLIWGYMGQGEGALGFSDGQIALVGSAFAIASIVGIFFSNQFADRNFSAEKFMAFSHFVGGLAMLGLYVTKSFPAFFGLMLLHSLFYVPTISVANSLSFANLKDPTKEFGPVRMGGTIGWILASWPLYFILQGKVGAEAMAATRAIFLVSGAASLFLAGFCLLLPHTPPRRAEAGDRFAWLKAGRQLMLPFILVLFVVTFIDATIHNGYFLVTAGFLENQVGFEKKWIMPIMSLGQVAEILTMLVLGLVLKSFGWKVTMIVGILGHAVRFAIYAFFPESPALIIAVQLVHGICYAFFFAAVYIFIDAAFPKDVRTSAQGWFNLLILGLGDLAAKWIFIPLQGHYTVDGVTNFRSLFLVPTGLALLAAVLLALFFNPPKEVAAAAKGGSAPAH
ncbi:MAG: MFS transporter [Limisphaerales bacterium]